MKNIIISVLLISTFICGCNKHISDQKPENKLLIDDTCLSDSSSYFVIRYYPDGGIKWKSSIQNQKKNGIWTEYYMDGEIRYQVKYSNNEIVLESMSKEPPILIFEHDSLKVGIPTKLRAVNLYLNEGIGCEGGGLIPSNDKDYYDFTVIPEQTDSVRFLLLQTYIDQGENFTEKRISLIKSLPVYE